MNFMGGGRRVVKVKTSKVNCDEAKMVDYIKQKVNEKLEKDAKGESLFKANDDNMIKGSQDIIRLIMVKKICSSSMASPRKKLLTIRTVSLKNPNHAPYQMYQEYKSQLKSNQPVHRLKMQSKKIKTVDSKPIVQQPKEQSKEAKPMDKGLIVDKLNEQSAPEVKIENEQFDFISKWINTVDPNEDIYCHYFG